MSSCQPGVMLSVSADEATLMSMLPERLGISAVNSSDRCVASGPLDAIELLEEKLKVMAIPCRRLRTSHAYHSPMMDPILDRFVAEVYKAKPSTPKIPFISNTSPIFSLPWLFTDKLQLKFGYLLLMSYLSLGHVYVIIQKRD